MATSLRERSKETLAYARAELELLRHVTSVPLSGGHYAGHQAGSGPFNFGSGVATGIMLEHTSSQRHKGRKQGNSHTLLSF